MKTKKEHASATGTVLAVATLALSASLLTGCSPARTPTASERQFMLAGKPIHISSLSCAADGNFSAAGSIRSTLGIERGVALYSRDHGATWREAMLEPPATGVALTHLDIPGTGPGSAPLLAGYHFARLSPPGPWWRSADHGASWHAVAAPLESPPEDYWWTPLSISQLGDNPPVFAYITRDPASSKLNPRRLLMRSGDNGRSWRPHGLPTALEWASLASDGSGHVILSGRTPMTLFGGGSYPLFWSGDAGLTWQRVVEAYSPMGFFHAGGGNVITYNTSERKGGRTLVAYSLDHGRNFVMSNDPDLNSSGMIEAIASDRRGRIIAITDSDHILVSDDDGVSWRIANDLPLSAVNYPPPRLLLFDNGVAVALMPGGLIMRSSDRGDSWHSVQSPLAEGNYGFTTHCSDGSGLIFASGYGMAIRSLDHGQTWQPVELR